MKLANQRSMRKGLLLLSILLLASFASGASYVQFLADGFFQGDLEIGGTLNASTIKSSEYCLNGNCITNWPSGSSGTTLPTNCADGQVVKSSSGSWVCGTDNVGSSSGSTGSSTELTNLNYVGSCTINGPGTCTCGNGESIMVLQGRSAGTTGYCAVSNQNSSSVFGICDSQTDSNSGAHFACFSQNDVSVIGLSGTGDGVPAGTIAAFNLDSCPTGWTLADGSNGTPDLRGQFVRGIDVGATGVDPDGERTLGDSQGDAIGSHTHTFNMGGSGGWGGLGPQNNYAQTSWISGAGQVDDGFTTTGTVGASSETRPKNVALLYCMKTTDGGSGSSSTGDAPWIQTGVANIARGTSGATTVTFDQEFSEVPVVTLGPKWSRYSGDEDTPWYITAVSTTGFTINSAVPGDGTNYGEDGVMWIAALPGNGLSGNSLSGTSAFSLCNNDGTAVKGSDAACAAAQTDGGTGTSQYSAISCQSSLSNVGTLGTLVYDWSSSGVWQGVLSGSYYACVDGTILVVDNEATGSGSTSGPVECTYGTPVDISLNYVLIGDKFETDVIQADESGFLYAFADYTDSGTVNAYRATAKIELFVDDDSNVESSPLLYSIKYLEDYNTNVEETFPEQNSDIIPVSKGQYYRAVIDGGPLRSGTAGLPDARDIKFIPMECTGGSGSSSTSMVTNWPDAIKCSNSGSNPSMILYLSTVRSSGDAYYYPTGTETPIVYDNEGHFVSAHSWIEGAIGSTALSSCQQNIADVDSFNLS